MLWDSGDFGNESARWTDVQPIHVDVLVVDDIDGRRKQPQRLLLLRPVLILHGWSELVALPSEVVSAPSIVIACGVHGKTVEVAVGIDCMDPVDPCKGTRWSQILQDGIHVPRLLGWDVHWSARKCLFLRHDSECIVLERKRSRFDARRYCVGVNC